MNDRTPLPIDDSRRFGSPGRADGEHSGRDEWMHDFRNALGTILVAADAAKFLIQEQRSVEISLAMGRIEIGCNRCLRLLRTMPPV